VKRSGIGAHGAQGYERHTSRFKPSSPPAPKVQKGSGRYVPDSLTMHYELSGKPLEVVTIEMTADEWKCPVCEWPNRFVFYKGLRGEAGVATCSMCSHRCEIYRQ
jgi:hypothetical protein